MFTDIVGYSSLVQKDESLALQLLEQHRKILRPLFSKHGGREVKTIGDAFLVEFASALQAINCAYEIQKFLFDFNSENEPGKKVQLRIGIHLGDVVHDQNDIYGDAVNIASRIEPLSTPGGICLTEQVYHQIKNKFDHPFYSIGRKTLKNIADDIEAYRIVMPWEEKTTATIERTVLDRHRVAVLPFASLSPDPNDEFFADGLTEELIAKLSMINGIEVIARTSVMQYKKLEKNAGQIGRELRAGTLVEGSVRKAGNRIRATAQLIDANTESHLWGESYNRNLDDIFEVQTEVAEKLASSLHLKLSDIDRKHIIKKDTANSEAYLEYLRGKVNLQRWDKESLETAINHFELAVRLDTNYVLAYCGLSEAYSKLGFLDIMDANEATAKSEHFARRALELDETSPEANLAFTYSQGGGRRFDFATREQYFKRAIELNPSMADAHEGLSAAYAFLGEWDKCIEECEKAVNLDPLSPEALGNAGTWYLYSGRYDRAVERLSQALEIDPGSSFHLANLGLAHVRIGEVKKGLQEVKMAAEKSGSHANYGDLAYAYVQAKQPEEARKILEMLLKPVEGKPLPCMRIAAVYAVLGEKENAIKWLEKAYDENAGYLPAMATDFVYENLRGEPGFEALLVKMRLKR